MSGEAEELRREIRTLFERRGVGDIPARTFEGRLAEASVALCRAVASERLASDEHILAEHHVEHSHLKLAGSVLQEPARGFTSLFATDSRLLRVCGIMQPGRPVTCDGADGTVVDALSYARIRRVTVRRQVRWGEAGVGLLVVGVALLLRDALAVTGPLLAVLGGAGALHGLLLPTRWIEITASNAQPEPRFEVHAARRRSARRLLAVVRDAVAAGAGRSRESTRWGEA